MSTLLPPGTPDALTPREVATIFRVDSKTVTRWADKGKLPCFRTPAGHRRFHRADVEALLRGEKPGGGS